MLTRARSAGVLVATALLLMALVAFGVRQYEGNLSGLLHMDTTFGETHQVPPGVVLYTDGGYDGMLYYEVARELPALFFGGEIRLDSPYRFQRALLPGIVYLLTFSNAAWFPFAFVFVNVVCALIALWLMLRLTNGKVLHALTIVANPAVLVGILFTLTEPLSLVMMVAFFAVWRKNGQSLSPLAILFLILSLLARETTVFLIGLLFVWYVWNKRWSQAARAVIPMLVLAAWQWFLVWRLGDQGFQANSNIVAWPFGGPIQVVRWFLDGHKLSYVITSLALLLFVLPLLGVLLREWMPVLRKRARLDVLTFLLSGLVGTLLCMDQHMWGVITSIGRVVTPLYPVYALWAADRDDKVHNILSTILITVSVMAAIGIAMVRHPYVIS